MSSIIVICFGFKTIIISSFSGNVQSKGKLLVENHYVMNVSEILFGNKVKLKAMLYSRLPICIHIK